MKRVILGVLAGFALWTVLWLAANAGLLAAFPDLFEADGSTQNAPVLLGFLGLSLVFSVLAGFLAATVARGREMRVGWILGWVQLGIGILVQIRFWDTLPVWYHLGFLTLLLPGILLGAHLRKTKNRAQIPV